MLPLAEALRRGQKYTERSGAITDAMIALHLAGRIALAAPAAVDGRAAMLPLDVDSGGMLAIMCLLEAACVRGLWAFGQYCPRAGLTAHVQHGYVWLVFDHCAEASRLQLLGRQLLGAVVQEGWKIEARAHAATTRLPLARHMHTGRFGELVLPDKVIDLDPDPRAGWVALRQCFQENPISSLPPLPAPKQAQERQQAAHGKQGITIERYNQDTDLVALLAHYGARAARGCRRLMHCCGHQDTRRASLLLWNDRSGKLHCKCLSQYHACPLADQMRDAFGVYCAMEGLSPADALRRLNGKEASRC
jgi:hypothetical protein